jgi:hypothetical protein
MKNKHDPALFRTSYPPKSRETIYSFNIYFVFSNDISKWRWFAIAYQLAKRWDWECALGTAGTAGLMQGASRPPL